MHQSRGLFVACLLSMTACSVENYEDCKEDELDLDGDFSVGHSKAGTGPAGSGASTGSGATAASGGTATEPEPEPEPPTPCEVEHDCAPGFNCDLDLLQCLPADAETCGELLTEQECTDRTDCTPIYGGTNCSCGADCECQGGEPGCICESFEFFVCREFVSSAP